MKFVIIHFLLEKSGKLKIDPFEIADTKNRYQFNSRDEAVRTIRDCNFEKKDTAVILESDFTKFMEVHELINAVEKSLLQSAIDVIMKRRTS